MRRLLVLSCALLLAICCPVRANNPPNAPTVIEPASDGDLASPEDVQMAVGPFSDPDQGDTLHCTDWEIWTVTPNELIWSASCLTAGGGSAVHLGDGVFQGSYGAAFRTTLVENTNYYLRVRQADSSGDPNTQWSPYSIRFFTTAFLSTVLPMEIQDIVASPTPALVDTNNAPIVLPGGTTPSSVSMTNSTGAQLLVQISGTTSGPNVVTNPASLSSLVTIKLRVDAGSASLFIPNFNLTFTDETGEDRTIYLPSVNLAPTQTAYFWVSDNGSTFVAQAAQTTPDFSVGARSAPVPWLLMEPGYRVDLFATGFTLPTNIAFVPNPGPNPTDPYFYVTELYGNIKVVRRNGTSGVYASNLLNFNPTGLFPGSGEQGVTGICVDPANGDLFVTMVYDSGANDGTHRPKIVKFHSNDGGQTAATQTIILDMPNEPLLESHIIGNIGFGPDGKLYWHIGDGFDTTISQNLGIFRGKIHRMNKDGTAPGDNPFYLAGDSTARNYVYAYGMRNPFGGTWRDLDGKHYEVENGPQVDRFAQVPPGRNFLWSGSNNDMHNFAIYNWQPPSAPVNITFIQQSNFGGSLFPAAKQDHAFVTCSGSTWSTGSGKGIAEFVLNAAGGLVSGPNDWAVYSGSGHNTCIGLAAGPDGLYFTNMYKDNGTDPTDPGADVLRIRWVGFADFRSNVQAGLAPLAVQFFDNSTVPQASAWQWSFGDGGTSTLQNPVHTYTTAGNFDVRLSVTGAGGAVVVQKTQFISTSAVARIAIIGGGSPNPTTADHAVTDHFRSEGFLVWEYNDAPANRPSAQTFANFWDLVIITATANPANIGGEFRTAPVPVIYWNPGLLTAADEPLTASGANVNSQTAINVINTTHPITQTLSPGALTVFSSASAMSVGQGAVPAGSTVLAQRNGAAGDEALVVADVGASLGGGYTTVARRAFTFFGNTSFLNATQPALDLLDHTACWAVNGFPTFITSPPTMSVTSGATAVLPVTVSGAGTLNFQWRHNGSAISDNGHYSGTLTSTLTISSAAAADAGPYDCVLTCPCGQMTSSAGTLTVNQACYPNCDGSTAPPILNVADFTCFLQRYAQGDPYANCDQSTAPPVLNVADFTCFLQKFAQGCH